MTAAPEVLVALRGVRCAHGPVPCLDGIDLTLTAGRFTGIVGPSGAGKTTLLRAIVGTVRPVAGTVVRRPGLRLGYVPQVGTVDWSFPVTVGELVRMARTERRRPWTDRAEQAEVDDLLGRLGLAGFAERALRTLSGGQQQRAFLARALLPRPDLVLLDEPTSGVDLRTRHEVLHLLGDLHADGLAVVLTTHDLNGIAAHLPEVVCLNGTITAAGPPADVLTPSVLERTYGAPVEVLHHLGVPVVLDRPPGHRHEAS